MLFIFVTNKTSAQSLPVPYVLTSDTATSVKIPGKYWQLMADTSGKITLRQAMQSGSFQNTNRKVKD